ncbi:hypothetical protein [Candidatus Protochlamydia phocaeensis]|nr:hypothetical protein [Candidatus Protochlamydia phocaeensis]
MAKLLGSLLDRRWFLFILGMAYSQTFEESCQKAPLYAGCLKR